MKIKLNTIDALSWARGQLSLANELCGMSEQFLDENEGRIQCFAFFRQIPTTISFSESTLGMSQRDYLAAYLRNRFLSVGRSLILFDDAMASPGRDCDAVPGANSFFWGENVYHAITNKQSSEKLFELIGQLISVTQISWHFLCVVFAEYRGESLVKILSGEISNPPIHEIIIGAFDGEGFIHFSLEKDLDENN